MHCLFAANDDPNMPMNLTEIIGLNNFDTSNVENMSMLFMNNSSLKEIDLSSWDFDKVTNFSSIFASFEILTKIKIKDGNAVNKISNYLPTKTIDNPGTITVIGDKTGINTTILESKHWNIN
jgi:surface protein